MTSELQPGHSLADAFSRTAEHYDLLVSISPGYHAQLRASAAELAARLPQSVTGASVVLDLGCGTGASTRALLEALRSRGDGDLEVYGVDSSAGMIEQARSKRWPESVHFECADALDNLRERESGSVSAVFAAYLVRNVADLDELLAEIARVLVPGGPLVIHEYSVAGNRAAQLTWRTVCRAIIIPAAFATDRDVRLYRYLLRSVLDFDSVEHLRERMARAGLRGLTHRTVRGWQRGIVHTLAGVRA